MKFTVDDEILVKFPDVKIGLLISKNIDNSGTNKQLLDEIKYVEREIKQKLDLKSLVNHLKIEDWRRAYSLFGAKPKTYKNSVESLLRKVLKEDSLPEINKVVNIYNMISIKHILPAGGDDVDKVEGGITLTIGKGGEQFTLLGSQKKEVAEPGEVIYRDNKEVLCRRWNWRECDKTKMTENTKNVCLVLEALGSTTKTELLNALKDLKENVDKYCRGASEMFILDGSKKTINIV